MKDLIIYKNSVDEINQLHGKIKKGFLDALNRGLRIGELLIQEKKNLKHGNWISWVNENLVFDKRQAQKYIQLFKNQDYLKANSSSHLALSSINTALSEIRNIKKSQNIEKIKKELPGKESIPGKYDVVILDPPWQYGRKYDAEGSRVASPYPEQSKEEIYEDCKGFFKDDCVLWLWTTHAFIWEAKDLLNDWGFQYKATLTWNKEKLGMGSWLRMQCEFCLLGIKGKPLWNLINERDLISEPRKKHSRKPDQFYELVKKICYGSIFEYYAREPREGIITKGIEIE